jgi:hypothetical protein
MRLPDIQMAVFFLVQPGVWTMNLLTLIPFIVNRYTFYMIPMDLEMVFCGFHYRRAWRNIICFCFCFCSCFLLEDWWYILYNSNQKRSYQMRRGIIPQPLIEYELARPSTKYPS